MIEIRVKDQALPLSSDFQLTREMETSIFDRDNNATDFTLPVDIPLTDEVLQILDNPHIVANPRLTRTYTATVIVDGLFTSTATLRILDTDNDRGFIKVSLIGNYGSFSRVVGSKKVNELTLGGVRNIANVQPSSMVTATKDNGKLVINYTPCDIGDHMEDVVQGSIVTDYCFYQACDEKQNLPIIHNKLELSVPIYVGDTEPRSIINPYHSNGATGEFIDVVRAYIESTYNNDGGGVYTYDRFFNVPFFRVKYVMEQCFKEFGFTVDWGILDNYNFEELTLYNTFAINKVNMSSSFVGTVVTVDITHHATSINPQNHVPKQTIVEFLTQMGKLFNAQYLIDYHKQHVKINVLKVLDPANGRVLDLTDKAYPKPNINFERQDIFNGFKFVFEPDPEDGASGGMVEDELSNYPSWGSYDNHLDLNGISSPAAGDIAYVKCENAYHLYNGTEWWPFSHNLADYQTSNDDELQSVTVKAVPTPMKRQHQVFRYATPNTGTFMGETDVTYTDNMLMPLSAMGIEGDSLLAIARAPIAFSGSTASGVHHANSFRTINYRNKETYPHVCNFVGYSNCIANDTDKYPNGSATRWLTNGVIGKGEMLFWFNHDGEGLHPEYWEDFTKKVSAGVQAKYKVLMDAALYSQFEPNEDYIKIGSSYFLTRAAEINMPFPDVMELTLVRI